MRTPLLATVLFTKWCYAERPTTSPDACMAAPDAVEIGGNCVDEDCDGRLDAGASQGFLDAGGTLLCADGGHNAGAALASLTRKKGLLIGAPAGGDLEGGRAYLVDADTLEEIGPGAFMPLPDVATATLVGSVSARAGTALAMVDYDDELDVLIGAPGASQGSPVGAVYLVEGPLEGEISLDTPLITSKDLEEASLGSDLLVGKLLGWSDSYDIVASAPGYGRYKGAVALVAGGTTPETPYVLAAGRDDSVDALIVGSSVKGFFGVQMALMTGEEDGYLDDGLLVSETGYDVSASQSAELGELSEAGAVWLIPADGFSDDGLGGAAWDTEVSVSDVGVAILGVERNSALGSTLASGRDLDGSGTDDVVVGTLGDCSDCADHLYVLNGQELLAQEPGTALAVDNPDLLLATLELAHTGTLTEPMTVSFQVEGGEWQMVVGTPGTDADGADDALNNAGNVYLLPIADLAGTQDLSPYLLQAGESAGDHLGGAVDVTGVQVYLGAPGWGVDSDGGAVYALNL